MNVLRILVDAPLLSNVAMPWSLHDASDALVRAGRGTADEWPDADRIEAVVAASQVRLASVSLPPLPPNRIAAAASYALEDRLAGTGEVPVLTVSPQRADGGVVVAIVARSLLSSLHSRATGRSQRIDRVIAEPDLVSPDPGWCWCAADDEDDGVGFVRAADGSAFPVSSQPVDGILAPELILALDHARRNGSLPAQVRVDAKVADESLERWHADTDIPFVRGDSWRWNHAATTAYATATNLLQGEFAAAAPPRAGDRSRSFKPAITIVVVALSLHIVATLGEWAWWRVEAWRTARAMRTLAVAAGVNEADAVTADSARTALARRYADVRHARRLAAPNDAIPLLARAAPALAATPAGLIKSATYADGHWTIDLQRGDVGVVRDLDMRLKRAGAPATTAMTATGARIRFGAE